MSEKKTTTVCLHSAPLFGTPGMVAYFEAKYSSRPRWAVENFAVTFELSKQCAKDVLSGKVGYRVEDDTVVFEYPTDLVRNEEETAQLVKKFKAKAAG